MVHNRNNPAYMSYQRDIRPKQIVVEHNVVGTPPLKTIKTETLANGQNGMYYRVKN